MARGHRQKENTDGLIPCVVEPDEKARPNHNWDKLIQKIYEIEPLTCPKCQGIMQIISIIEDQEVVDKILVHFGRGPCNRPVG